MNEFELSRELATTKDLDLIMEHVNSKSRHVLSGVCENPITPTEALLEIFDNPDVFISREATTHENFPLHLLEDIVFNDHEIMLRIVAVSNPKLNEKTLISVIKANIFNTDDRLMSFLFGNPNVTVDSIATLVTFCSDFEVPFVAPLGLLILVSNTKDTDILQFALDNDFAVAEIAQNKAATERMLVQLTENFFDEGFMIDVGRHKQANTAVLEKLSRHSDLWVRTKVALHKNTSQDALLHLSRDSNAAVRKNVAKNKNTSVSVLNILKSDKSTVVQTAANKNLNSR